jgi:hypothetical protein
MNFLEFLRISGAITGFRKYRTGISEIFGSQQIEYQPLGFKQLNMS